MTRASTRQRLVNLALQQLGWFACVLGAAHGHGEIGATLAAALVLLHLGLARDRRGEATIIVTCGAVGLVVDSLQAATGRLVFAESLRPTLAPPWVLVLWMQLGTTLRGALAWLSGRRGLASVLGLAGGPLAFLGGERLGAVVWGEPRWLTWFGLGVVWSTVMPLFVFVADRVGGRSPSGYRWP